MYILNRDVIYDIAIINDINDSINRNSSCDDFRSHVLWPMPMMGRSSKKIAIRFGKWTAYHNSIHIAH